MNFKKIAVWSGVVVAGAITGVVAYKNVGVVAASADKVGAVLANMFKAASDTISS